MQAEEKSIEHLYSTCKYTSYLNTSIFFPPFLKFIKHLDQNKNIAASLQISLFPLVPREGAHPQRLCWVWGSTGALQTRVKLLGTATNSWAQQQRGHFSAALPTFLFSKSTSSFSPQYYWFLMDYLGIAKTHLQEKHPLFEHTPPPPREQTVLLKAKQSQFLSEPFRWSIPENPSIFTVHNPPPCCTLPLTALCHSALNCLCSPSW